MPTVKYVDLDKHPIVFGEIPADQSFSDFYTPTFTAVDNINGFTVVEFVFMRMGPMVHVFGAVEVDPTSPGVVEFLLSLPVPSVFTLKADLIGMGTATTTRAGTFVIVADVPTGSAHVYWDAQAAGLEELGLLFSYRIR